ncbi:MULTISPECIES: TIGR02678 family protein [Clostridium]|uniref:TIGR02678 family protein n=1 Tax=Clostridium beijerinckii TaxID=1520 RepID=A0A1S9N6M6_CLOBE|nr:MULTISPECIES: TIGR02678 family protein [Clostridium]MBN7576965.1 TIGR02678 family protein [Clostridium beijerinckii]MBN7581943.1 TIGR02678 family protein [Clostridium beijerinckii]MBN7586746.1 TIGR02678 family protein [Clostridium beijerinckii]MBO0522933.1 TIGR02678 family protein [Clostridium beijerinckii]OOP73227.1 TIGR02678 family protein [Clostridium beijerinckii]
MKFTQLLENYIILKEKDRELYYDIIDNIDNYREFINDNLSYNLIIKEDFIKLEKIPAIPKSWMGIQSFNNKKEYIFFLLILMYLEDKNKEEQFILSNVTEYIEHNYPGEKIEWTVFKNRKSLITVLKFSLELGIIKKNDGEEEEFNKSENGEVLYESTGISRYVVRRFNREIFDSESYIELLEDAIEGISTDKGIIRKNRVFRELTLSPIVYNNENSSDYEYIKNYRNSIKSTFEKYLEWDIHIHKNGAMAVIKNANEIRDTFPNGKGESAITLFVNRKIKDMLEDGKLIINEKDTIIIKEELFDKILLEVKKKYGHGFTKAFRDALDSYYLGTIKRFMEEYYLINVKDGYVELMPLIVKATGKYPDDYNGEEK